MKRPDKQVKISFPQAFYVLYFIIYIFDDIILQNPVATSHVVLHLKQ